MARYYLVPNESETDAMAKRGCKNVPKYLDFIKGQVRGITDFDGRTSKKFYILILDDKEDLSEFEKQTGVVKLDETLNKTKVQNIIGTTVSGNPTQDEIEQLLTNWLTGDSKTLRTL